MVRERIVRLLGGRPFMLLPLHKRSTSQELTPYENRPTWPRPIQQMTFIWISNI